ncbi:MAG: hypothetical protein ACOYKE_09750 [Ferruginibacter sp.]
MKVRKLLTSQLLRFAAFIVIFILPVTLFAQLPNPGGGMGGGGSNPDPPPTGTGGNGVPINDHLTLILLCIGLVVAVTVYRKIQRREAYKMS